MKISTFSALLIHYITTENHSLVKTSTDSLVSLFSGTLSEEATEHRNKNFRKFLSQNSRKMSRKYNLMDIFRRFLLTSDPLLSHCRASSKMKKKKRILPRDVLDLCLRD